MVKKLLLVLVLLGFISFVGTSHVYGKGILMACGTSVSAPSFACVGQTISVTGTALGGNSATLSTDGAGVFTQTGFIVSNPIFTYVPDPSDVFVTFTCDNGGENSCVGGQSTISTSTTINPLPTVATSSIPSIICTGGTSNLNALPSGGLAPYSYSWTPLASGLSSTTIPNPVATPLSTITYSVVVTDANLCSSVPTPVTVTVNPIPTITGVVPGVQCGPGITTLSATASAGIINWYTAPTGGSLVNTGPTFSPSIPSTTTYFVDATASGCTSPVRTPVAGTVNLIPAAPVLGSNSPVCSGLPINLNAAFVSGGSYSWTGPNTFSSTLQNPTIGSSSAINAGTYFCTVTVLTCVSTSASVNVIVNPTPTISGVVPGVRCGSGTVGLSATASAGTISWYNAPSGGVLLGTGPTYTTPIISTTTSYYVDATASGCTSPTRTLVTATVNVIPAPPTLGSNSPVCSGLPINLNAQFVSGGSYSWTGPSTYASNLQNPIIPGAAPINAGTYFCNVTVLGCVSANNSITVVVITPPTITGVTPGTRCGAGIVPLSATASSGTINWYTVPTLGSVVNTGPGYSPSIPATTSYYVDATASGCTTPVRSLVTATVNLIPTPPLIGSNSPVCSGLSINLNASFVAGGSYSWTGPNAFISSVQNPIIASASAINAGTYFCTVSVLGCISSSSSANVVVNATPIAPATGSNSPICAGSTLNLTTGVIASTYSWTGPASFTATTQNANIGSATVAAAGTYNLVVTSAAGCISPPGTVVVIVDPVPTVNANSDQVKCANNPVTALNGSKINAIGAIWSGGAGTFSPNNTTLNATYTPTAAEIIGGGLTLTLTSTGTGACAAVNDPMTIVINPSPTINVGADQIICQGAGVPLTAAVTGSPTSILWTTTGTGTFTSASLFSTNYTHSVPEIGAGAITLTATVSKAGCINVSDNLTLTVNPNPTLVITNPASVCAPGTADISLPALRTGSVGVSSVSYWTNSGATLSLGTPSAVGGPAGTYTNYIRGVSAAGCFAIQPITVTVTNPPTVVITNPATVCAPSTVDLTLPAVTTGSTAGLTFGYFTNAGATIAVLPPNTISASSTYYIKGTDAFNCFDIKPVIVAITPGPTANAGTDISVCSNNPSTALAGGVTIATGGSWSGGSGVFIPDNLTLNATYIPTASEVLSGSVNLTLQSTGNGSCAAVNDVMKISYTSAPSSNAGPDKTLCASNPSIGLNGIVTIASGGNWSSVGGSGSFAPSSSVLNTSYTPGATEIALGYATLILTTTGNGSCIPVADTVVINYTPNPTLLITNPPSACVPSTVDITGASVTAGSAAGLTYTYWTNSGATAALAAPASLAISTTYYIKGTDATSCFTIQPVVVTINPIPTLLISDPAAVCIPSTVNIMSPSIVTGSTPGLIYSYWQDASASIIESAAASVPSSGTFYIKGLNSTTSCFNIKPVTVVANSGVLNTTTVSPSYDTICEGQNTSVTINATQAGVSYAAFDAGTQLGAAVLGDGTNKSIPLNYTSLFPFGNEITIQGSLAGCPTVTLLAKDSVFKSVIAAPSIISFPSTFLCIPDSVILSVPGSFAKYEWHYGVTSSYASSSQVVNAATNKDTVYIPGYYFLKVTDIYGCSVKTPGLHIAYNGTLPVISQSGNTGTQVDMHCTAATTYQWYVENATGKLKYIKGANTANLRTYFDGKYYVASKNNNCYLYSNKNIVSGMAGGNILKQGFLEDDSSIVIPDIDIIETIEVFPNPSFGRFEVQYISTSNEVSVVNIYSAMDGKLIAKKEYSVQGFISAEFNEYGLSNGIYFVEVVKEGKRLRKKITIQK